MVIVIPKHVDLSVINCVESAKICDKPCDKPRNAKAHFWRFFVKILFLNVKL